MTHRGVISPTRTIQDAARAGPIETAYRLSWRLEWRFEADRLNPNTSLRRSQSKDDAIAAIRGAIGDGLLSIATPDIRNYLKIP